ncbi:uncharacterized protein [Epargyreus clarus]|uniref:uncharacterized protein n=1 Tax=Epargyreus clarus TaxID=520877 RepID=UPI003C2CF7BF
MNVQPCNHIRIRDGEGYEKNIETLIKLIENQFKTDFTSLPNWKDLLKNIGDKKQEYESKIKSANRRKLFIIDKLHVQNFRPSPFILTDNLARTAYLWKDIELEHKKRKEYPKLDAPSGFEEITEITGEISDMNLTAHPNSEIHQSTDIKPITQATPVEIETSVSHLPVNICTNPHKLISPLKSEFSVLNIQQKEPHEHFSIPGSQEKEGLLINQTKCIVCKPSTIKIDSNILKKQVIKFVLTNSCTDALYVRFKSISDKYPFKRANIYPETAVKLCPGLSVVYKFVFKLKPNIDNYKMYIYFRIGHNVISSAPEDILNIPVYLKPSAQDKIIFVTETVNICPVYSWQINVNCNFPHENLDIYILDDNSYNMHIKKRVVDFIEERQLRNFSIDVTGVNTDSLLQKMEDDDIETQSLLMSTSKKEDLDNMECMSITGVISLVVEDIVNLALDTFIFERTFLYLIPFSKSSLSVLFSKAEHEGYHQCYYDLEFFNPDTDFLIRTKTIKVFAEALSHPVQIHPKILDMSESPINFGFREDYFVVTNTHKVFLVRLKIKVTKKMRQLFQINPMELTIPCSSSANFVVRACCKKLTNGENRHDLVHFTIKIIVSGHKSIYRNVPPIFYEIVIPCAAEFEKIYGNN